MGIINDINSLEPMTALKCRDFLRICTREGIPVAINETRRMPETQLLYYLQGRLGNSNPDIRKEFNDMRKRYKFWELSSKEMDTKITFTLNSKHLGGKAFDVVPLNKDGNPWWDAPIEVWTKIGLCGEEAGLQWGGRWEIKDNPHFEDMNG